MVNPEMPGFAKTSGEEAYENQEDEAEILGDVDVTRKSDNLSDDNTAGAPPDALEALEDEPGDFMRGEVDVKEQMDRAANALDSSIHGYPSQADEDSPNTELGASFYATPGGLEEVEQKTEEELARHRHPPKHRHH